MISGLLVLLAIIIIRKGWGIAILLIWIFNIIGTADLLNTLFHVELVLDLGATWYILAFFVPLLLVTHAMIFMRLFKYQSKKLIAV